MAYASKALVETQQRYAQIDKEILAIVFGFEKFRQMTFGRKTIVHSYHKPLEAITKKPLHKAPSCLQGKLMTIQGYDKEIVWKPGDQCISRISYHKA